MSVGCGSQAACYVGRNRSSSSSHNKTENWWVCVSLSRWIDSRSVSMLSNTLQHVSEEEEEEDQGLIQLLEKVMKQLFILGQTCYKTQSYIATILI